MKLEAINRVQGVKVLDGKGEGTDTAHAGDIFEARNDAEAKRLIKLEAAKEYKVEDRLADKGGKPKAPAKKSTGTKSAAKKSTGEAKPSGEQKAEDGSDTADESDLGLEG